MLLFLRLSVFFLVGNSAVRKLIKNFKESRYPHSRPQRPRPFWSAQRIATAGKVQHRKSTIHGLSVIQSQV